MDDVANMAGFPASDLSAFVSGQHLVIGGGAPAEQLAKKSCLAVHWGDAHYDCREVQAHCVNLRAERRRLSLS